MSSFFSDLRLEEELYFESLYNEPLDEVEESLNFAEESKEEIQEFFLQYLVTSWVVKKARGGQ